MFVILCCASISLLFLFLTCFYVVPPFPDVSWWETPTVYIHSALHQSPSALILGSSFICCLWSVNFCYAKEAGHHLSIAASFFPPPHSLLRGWRLWESAFLPCRRVGNASPPFLVDPARLSPPRPSLRSAGAVRALEIAWWVMRVVSAQSSTQENTKARSSSKCGRMRPRREGGREEASWRNERHTSARWTRSSYRSVQ